jgi:hypothetical protein
MDGMMDGRSIGGIVSGGEGQMNEIGYPLSDYILLNILKVRSSELLDMV